VEIPLKISSNEERIWYSLTVNKLCQNTMSIIAYRNVQINTIGTVSKTYIFKKATYAF
jgi:hypothetical protein